MRPANLADTLYALGHWLVEQARTDDAAHVYRTLLLTAPDDERGWLGLAFVHEARGEDELADGLYLLAEKAVPTSFRAALARARLRRRVDAGDGIDEAFERAIDLARSAGEEDAAASIRQEWSGA